MFVKRFKNLHQLIHLGIFTLNDDEIIETDAFSFLMRTFFRIKKENAKVYIIGNGGSAAIASHTSVDLINGCEVAAFTLYDSNVLTCLSNDYGYEEVFSRPLQLSLQKEDLLIAISSSGKSKNILNAVEVAKEKDATVFTLSGFGRENPLRKSGDLNYWIGSKDYGLVEMGHFCLLHTVTDTLKEQWVLQAHEVYA